MVSVWGTTGQQMSFYLSIGMINHGRLSSISGAHTKEKRSDFCRLSSDLTQTYMVHRSHTHFRLHRDLVSKKQKEEVAGVPHSGQSAGYL